MLLGAIYEAVTWARPPPPLPPVSDVGVFDGFEEGVDVAAQVVKGSGRLVPPYVLGAMAVGFLSLGWYLWPAETDDLDGDELFDDVTE